jgi:predicted esterase
MRRRAFVRSVGLALPAAIAGCRSEGDRPTRGGDARAPAASPLVGSWRELSLPAPSEERALALCEPGAPTLVALHGAGEAARGPEAGARGWRDDYDLDRANARLKAPPLTPADLGGFVRPGRLREINASLGRHAYRGLNVLCPYTPRLADRSAEGAEPFARFVLASLLDAARDAGAHRPGARLGIDGVSMGGRLALLVGLGHPAAFAAVGALQPAIHASEAPWLSALAARARDAGMRSLRLVSSDEDPFLPAVTALSERLARDGVAHALVVTPGPHDYAWNRGPGAVEMLVWHERVLRGLAPP